MRNLKFLYGSNRRELTVNSAMVSSSGLRGRGLLLDAHDDEFGGLQRCEPDDDVHDPAIDVVLGGGFRAALDEVRIPRRAALEGTLAEEVLHERADRCADL